MAIFNITEKQQKSHFFLQFFLIAILVTSAKVDIPSNFTPSPSLAANLFALIRYAGRATASHLVHTDHGSIFNFTTTVHSHSDLPPKFHACCVLQWSQLPKYAVLGRKIHPELSSNATSFRGCHFSSSTSNGPNSLTKYNI